MFFNADQTEGAIAKVAPAPAKSGHPALSPKQFGKPGTAAPAEGAGDAAGAATEGAAAGGAEAGAAASGLAELAPLALLA